MNALNAFYIQDFPFAWTNFLIIHDSLASFCTKHMAIIGFPSEKRGVLRNVTSRNVDTGFECFRERSVF